MFSLILNHIIRVLKVYSVVFCCILKRMCRVNIFYIVEYEGCILFLSTRQQLTVLLTNTELVCGLFDKLVVMCQKPGIQRSVIGDIFNQSTKTETNGKKWFETIKYSNIAKSGFLVLLVMRWFWLFCSVSLVYLLSKTCKLFDFLIFWYWQYLIKVIPDMRRAH